MIDLAFSKSDMRLMLLISGDVWLSLFDSGIFLGEIKGKDQSNRSGLSKLDANFRHLPGSGAGPDPANKQFLTCE